MSTIIIDTEVLRNANEILDNDKTYYQNKQTTFNNIYGNGGNLSEFLNSIRESYQNASDNISNVSTYIDEYISNVETLENKMSSCSSIIDVDIPDLYFNVTSYTSTGELDKAIDDVKIRNLTRVYIDNDDKLKEELARLGVNLTYTPEKKIKEGTNDILVVKFANGVECEYKVLEDGSLQLLYGVLYDEEDGNRKIYEAFADGNGKAASKYYYNGYYDTHTFEEYDGNENLISKITFCGDNVAPLYRETNVYNASGVIESQRIIDALSQTITENSYISGSISQSLVYAIDGTRNGTLLSTTNWDYENQQVVTYYEQTDNQEASKKVSQYDNGVRLWTCYYDADNQFVMINTVTRHSQSTIEQTVDANNNVFNVKVTSDGSATGNKEAAYYYFVSQGYTKEAAAAICGNLMWESGGGGANGILLHTVEGGSGEGIGMLQWSFGRKTAFKQYCLSQGVNWTESDIQLQCDYMLQELNGGQWTGGDSRYGSAASMSLEDFKNCTDISQATTAFCARFERPSYEYSGLSTRISYANKTYSTYN